MSDDANRRASLPELPEQGPSPTAQRQLLFASRNRGKLRELRALTEDLPLLVVSLDDVGISGELPEEADTFAANALQKATAAAHLSGLLTLADDSGLEVDALGGRPGVASARYGGEPRCDARNNARLLEELAGVAEPLRTARFRCAVALVDPKRPQASQVCEGKCEGRILFAPRGSQGFGFDPLFLVPELGQTFAELPGEVKNRLSHRAMAMRAMREVLAALLSGGPLSTCKAAGARLDVEGSPRR